MKRYLKFDFEARVGEEIVYAPGIHEVDNSTGSADRWIKRGAVEISHDEYKKSKSKNVESKPPQKPPAPPAPPKDSDKLKTDADDTGL